MKKSRGFSFLWFCSLTPQIRQVSDPTSFFLDALNALSPALSLVFDFAEDGLGFVTPRVEIDIDVDLFLVLHLLFLVLLTTLAPPQVVLLGEAARSCRPGSHRAKFEFLPLDISTFLQQQKAGAGTPGS